MRNKLAVLISLFVFACSANKPTITQPITVIIQTDAGEKICEYVTITVEGKEAQVGVCSENSEDLQLAVSAVRAAVPFAREAFKK